MLREIKVRQLEDDPPRRWFASPDFDLIVWYRPDDSILGFQLCYDKRGAERAVTWLPNDGYTHAVVDRGDQDPRRDVHPALGVDAGPLDVALIDRFRAEADELPEAARAFVLAGLSESRPGGVPARRRIF